MHRDQKICNEKIRRCSLVELQSNDENLDFAIYRRVQQCPQSRTRINGPTDQSQSDFARSLATGHDTRVRTAALVAGLARSRLEQQTTGCATRELCWAVDCEIMPAGLLMVALHCNAIAAYTTRTTAVQSFSISVGSFTIHPWIRTRQLCTAGKGDSCVFCTTKEGYLGICQETQRMDSTGERLYRTTGPRVAFRAWRTPRCSPARAVDGRILAMRGAGGAT